MRDVASNMLAPIIATLNAAAKTVTFNTAIVKAKLFTIVNVTANVEIYTANDETNGGTLDGGNTVLTVDYDTTGMNNTDRLQVLYEGVDSGVFTLMRGNLANIDDNTPTIGQKDSANSSPVVIASDQTPVQVDAANPFPVTGPLTDAQLRSAPVDVNITNTAAPPATEAKQDTQITAADLTNTNLGADVTTPSPAMPAGGSGVRGWLSAIWTKLNATLAVTQSGTWTITATPPKAASANTPAIVTSGGDVIASNAARKSWGITNLGTNPLFVRMATGATSSVFHFILAPGVANDDGFGASVSDDIYTGVVSATGTSPRFTVYEL